MGPIEIKISADYLQRENIRGNYVHDWIKKYALKNKIGISSEEGKVILTFKSGNQRCWFVRKGNQNFPYFEFI